MRRFVRIREGKLLLGVASGLAHYFHCDVRLMRIGLVALALLNTGGLAVIVLYLILAACTPIVATATDAE